MRARWVVVVGAMAAAIACSRPSRPAADPDLPLNDDASVADARENDSLDASASTNPPADAAVAVAERGGGDGGAPVKPCAPHERKPLTFVHQPIYTDKAEKDGVFSARMYVGNPAQCARKVHVGLSFTPPRTTASRTVDFSAYVGAGGAFIQVHLTAAELEAAHLTRGRYAITFALADESGDPIGKALSGNPFRFGRDDIAVASQPVLPKHLRVGEDLVIPITIRNTGDTANRVTPLVVFTRPGETAGIEHYEAQQLVVPGESTYVLKLTREQREAEKIGPGAWLVTVTLFDAAGDRMNSYAGLPLTIGDIDLRMTRPELPSKIKLADPFRVTFKLENRGDTRDMVTTVIAFTKPGTTASHEFTVSKEVGPGQTAVQIVLDRAQREAKSVGRGTWLVTTAAFRRSGERIQSFTGHFLEVE